MMVGDLKKTVVLLDQVPTEVAAGSTEADKRPVTRIITAGTLVSESFLNSSENSFIAAIHFSNSHLESIETAPANSPVGVAWLDISVGSFYYQLTTVSELMNEIVRINPKEVLLDSAAKKLNVVGGDWAPQLSELSNFMITYKKFPSSTSFVDYMSRFNQPPAEVLYSVKDADEKSISAMCVLLKYMTENLPGSIIKLKTPEHQTTSEYMKIDSTTRKSLELFESTQNSESVRGTLYNVIDRTVTQSGARLLRSWLSSPLLSVEKIKTRQDYVEYFLERPTLTARLIHSIEKLDDCQRTVQKLGMQKFDVMDLVAVSRSISTIADIHRLVTGEIKAAEKDTSISILKEWYHILDKRLPALQKLSKSIDKSINIEVLEADSNDEGLVEGEPGYGAISPELLELQRGRKAKREAAEFRSILKPTASKKLEKLDLMQGEYLSEMEQLDQKFKTLHDNLKVSLKWAPQYGYHVHISGTESKLGSISNLMIDGHRIKPTKKTIVIQNEEWIQLGLKKDYIQSKREAEEQTILNKLRESALLLADSLRECCVAIDEMDVTSSFSILARERSLVRPTITDDDALCITSGRHMTVEAGLYSTGSQFVANDCDLGGKENPVWMITGPNMGGKSTFIRQVALITVLAQIGCYVPASSATIGIVDRLFCRIGAGDDLYRGRSTFMVEMLETGNILKHATSRSLAILDEVGRGTSGRDGLAVSYATIAHLLDVSKCRCLYATHFGIELADLLAKNSKGHNISFYRTSIRSDFEEQFANAKNGMDFLFDHKLEKGISQNSHGLRIAALAGFPASALAVANSVWDGLGNPNNQ
ncbi:mismatch repair ATPase MSH1 [Sugiyamaella lignohabitans]|uniref:Mismatch repair ATPase MSH1 n=1 Tax=Sugiyamaella lignohabitans TaxID=796027 RepID=A0A167D1C4_9ASCO|nr:mismatch repair ATPase MSH1 [Sugiyamaella lignohabitans]ANB12359.1 mismatch repair ATPase MSH1 [Sugiyamaella lignohabitans]